MSKTPPMTKSQIDLFLEALRSMKKQIEKMDSSPKKGQKLLLVNSEIERLTAELEGRE